MLSIPYSSKAVQIYINYQTQIAKVEEEEKEAGNSCRESAQNHLLPTTATQHYPTTTTISYYNTFLPTSKTNKKPTKSTHIELN